MGEEMRQNGMNLDLNLGPVVHPSPENEPAGLNLEDWLDGSIRHRTIMARQRLRSIWQPALELMSLSGLSGSEIGEGSMAAEGTPSETAKKGDNGNGYLEIDTEVEKEDVVKRNGYFDCNICLNMASDPVVACCGHLFCWPCLYRWLHIRSEAKECPVCKVEMTTKSVTPIYGRGNPTRVVEEDSSIKIPHRPQAKRVESWRQTIQRNAFTMPMDEMIRRLGSRFDLTRDLIPGQGQGHPENQWEISERNNSLLNRYLASRGFRTERERSGQPVQERTPSMEDRDSMSSIAAVIQSESQTVDTAVEIDSRVSVSTDTSSSRRRRSESSRVSDVDSGDSRAPRRRRFS